MLETLDIGKILLSYSIKKGLDKAFSRASKKILEKKGLRFQKNIVDLSSACIQRLANETAAWSNYMEFSYSGKTLNLSSLYVELNLLLEPRFVSPEEKAKRISLKPLLKKLENHFILLGLPGSGKTTTVKALCYDLLLGKSPLKGYFPVPIVVRLREVDNSLSVYEHLLTTFGVSFVNNEDDPVRLKDLDYEVKQDVVLTLLNQNQLVVIFDGFDEIENSAVSFRNKDTNCKAMFVMEFKSLCLNVTTSLIVLTSRTADFHFHVAGANIFELSPLSNNQIRTYLEKFFPDAEDRNAAENEIVNRKLLGSEHIPLTLSYLCMIYRRYGRLFNSRRETYNKLLDLLLENWDIDRQIQRKSSFAEFDVYDKKVFLRHMAFELSTRYGGSYFSEEQLTNVFKVLCDSYEHLYPRQQKQVLREIETHTGLFIRSGEGYVFSHRTMQEYLFALYLYEFPEVPKDKDLLRSFPNELALAVSFNENPSLYLAYLLMQRFDESFYEDSFFFPFIDRMILEKTNFKAHPYLGICVLLLYSGIRTTNRSISVIGGVQRQLSYFFRFLAIDEKLRKSFALLGKGYKITEEYPAKNIFRLKKIRDVDPKTAYLEPEELYGPYDFYEYFVNDRESATHNG